MIDKDFRYRGGDINVELAEKYASRCYQLQQRVANDAAAAARSSTQLKNMSRRLEGVLDHPQLLALHAAASVTAKLAQDLRALKPWAKAYAAHVSEKATRQREQDLLDRSRRRWSEDREAVAEAADLITFLSTQPTSADVEAFIAAHRRHERVYRRLSSTEAQFALEQLPTAVQRMDVPAIRRQTMLVIDQLGQSFSDRTTWFVGADDFHAWRDAQVKARTTADLTFLALKSRGS